MNLKVVAVLTATAALVGCAHTQNTTNNTTIDEIDYTSLGYVVLNGAYPREDGYFVVFDMSNEQHPQIIGIHSKRPRVENWVDKEILFVSNDLTEVQPDWHVLYERDEDDKRFICRKGQKAASEFYNQAYLSYNPCDSRLTTYLDYANNQTVVAHYMGRIKEYSLLNQYPVGLSNTRTVRLIESTQMMTAVQAKLREFAAQERATIERQQREIEYTHWRRTLAVGSSTFCGYVVELKGPMVKIAVNAPLQGYDSEQWLKIDEVYPARLGCLNRNGILSTMINP